MERFVKIVSGFQPLTIFTKRTILDNLQGSEYTYDNQESANFSDHSVFKKLTDQKIWKNWMI